MDRKQAFTEYGRILQDTEDWLSFGYRRNHADPEIILPQTHSSADASPEPPDAASQTEAPSETPAVSPGVRPGIRSGSPGAVQPAIQPVARPATGAAALNPSAAEYPAETSAPLKKIGEEIAVCSGCNLYLTRQNTVPGVGRTGAVLMIITPPPSDGAGFDSGPLPIYEYEYLEKWITALGLDPQMDIFITPAVKCRTPAGRPPHPEETAACSSFLRRQYKEVKPRAVLALGAAACGVLTGNQADFPSLVGREWTWGSVPALVLWTPAEVLASPARLRGPVWESLKQLKAAWNALPGNQL